MAKTRITKKIVYKLERIEESENFTSLRDNPEEEESE